jgi:hypothetical protein
MGLGISKVAGTCAIAAITGGLALAAVVVTHRDANAAGTWCAYIDQSVQCEWNTKRECRRSNPRKTCFPKSG